ncbi:MULTISPECIES: hypothetical protein [Moorena]|uniref:Uncharacterized protein n=1 Tax=Moorena producens 3L TaxID=489825 RepID=F4XL25_9CYAN|nr:MULTISPECIES: hypothetical protein [Moorena]NES85173.1 hypothetical protein [Moorena sp. SIO2B7]EGJ34715.1 hypothetical protein LYNGBM3L_13530 [Moorena producens 3L]NEP34697.1 hypothetical protein [Moorena sp. SIO3B2]NEP68719.1 hypothetical protein [Moorena sp. SIO3A5]NEQ09416.1 hypothetical protein [Moorena sp. SIO4E2]
MLKITKYIFTLVVVVLFTAFYAVGNAQVDTLEWGFIPPGTAETCKAISRIGTIEPFSGTYQQCGDRCAAIVNCGAWNLDSVNQKCRVYTSECSEPDPSGGWGFIPPGTAETCKAISRIRTIEPFSGTYEQCGDRCAAIVNCGAWNLDSVNQKCRVYTSKCSEPDSITEDFTGGTFDSANFEIGGGTGNATDAGWASVTNRGTLRTVASNLKPSIDNPLTIEADITFTPANEIAFLQVRGDGLPSGSFDEPSNGIYLRLHNFQNGHTGVSFGGPFMEFFRKDPPGGDSFWDDPVHLLLTDDGSTISVTLTNTVTNVVNAFSINDMRSSGGYVAFSTSANGARWDNISITHNNLTGK